MLHIIWRHLAYVHQTWVARVTDVTAFIVDPRTRYFVQVRIEQWIDATACACGETWEPRFRARSLRTGEYVENYRPELPHYSVRQLTRAGLMVGCHPESLRLVELERMLDQVNRSRRMDFLRPRTYPEIREQMTRWQS